MGWLGAWFGEAKATKTPPWRRHCTRLQHIETKTMIIVTTKLNALHTDKEANPMQIHSCRLGGASFDEAHIYCNGFPSISHFINMKQHGIS